MAAEDEKRIAGEAAVALVKDGMAVGLGTGSTVRYFIQRLGQLAREGMSVIGVPTSMQTERLAAQAGIKVGTLQDHPELDLTVDGADEVDPKLDLIKGLGGALFREKIVAKASKRFVVVVDSSKVVRNLGEKTPVPVEVHVFGWKATLGWLSDLGCKPSLRKSGMNPYMTDNGNFIVDCAFGGIPDPAALEENINNIPGAVQNGIFAGMADLVIVGKAGGVKRLERAKRAVSAASGSPLSA
jgi:ribose 5-phosphate isomerase A